MVNDRMYYSQEAELRTDQERIMAALVFLLIGLGMGAAVATLLAMRSRHKSRPGLMGAIEDRFNTIEKDLSDLGKKVEHRLKEIQR